MYLHLISVGTSILRNFVSFEKEDFVKKYKMKDWYMLDPEDEKQRKIEALAYRGNEVFEKLLNYVNSMPKEASAELNAFYRFIDFKMQNPSKIEIYLYSTDTGTSWLCTNIIYHHLNERGFKVQQPIKLKGIGKGILHFEEGLIEIIDKVVGIIKEKKAQGFRIFVNATAGFKPESTFIVMAASLAFADQVYYIHESFKETVTIPLLPVIIDPNYIEILKMLKNPMPKYLVKEHLMYRGIELAELEERGLIKEEEGVIELREWVKKLIEF